MYQQIMYLSELTLLVYRSTAFTCHLQNVFNLIIHLKVYTIKQIENTCNYLGNNCRSSLHCGQLLK